MKSETFETSNFFLMASEASEQLENIEEIESRDLTEEFYHEIEQMIINKELVIITINGKVRKGKSSIAIKLGYIIMKILYENGFRDNMDFGCRNIARDQIEQTNFFKDSKNCFDVIVTDEFNELESSGINSTTIRALQNDFSNIQAARYIHKINCAPKDVVDPNCDLILQVASINRKSKTSFCYLYYNLFKNGVTRQILLGYVRIYVGDIINNWSENVEDIFLKQEKTKEENEYIKEECEKDFYCKYMIRKHSKMDLLTKHKIFRPRTLDYSELTLKAIEELKKLANIGNFLTKAVIKGKVVSLMRELGIESSVLGEEDATGSVLSTIELYKALSKLKTELEKYKTKKKTVENIDILKALEEKIIEIEEAIKIVQKSITENEIELKRLIKLRDEYKEE